MPLATSPTALPAARATSVFISPMTAEVAETRFPALRGLPARSRVFVVISEIGRPLLVTDTHAEAARQIARQAHYVLHSRH